MKDILNPSALHKHLLKNDDIFVCAATELILNKNNLTTLTTVLYHFVQVNDYVTVHYTPNTGFTANDAVFNKNKLAS